MNDMRSMLRQADQRVEQAICILTLLQYSKLDGVLDRDGHVLVDEAVISAALRGVNVLLESATDIQDEVADKLKEWQKEAAS